MIKINGQLCYSPAAPSRYSLPHLGLGLSCRDDVQLWNLLYLSCERIEEHLDPLPGADVGSLVTRDLCALTTACASLYGPTCLKVFPNLRKVLTLHPSAFLRELWTMPWQHLPPAMVIPDWADIITDKVATIHAQGALDLGTSLPFLKAPYEQRN